MACGRWAVVLRALRRPLRGNAPCRAAGGIAARSIWHGTGNQVDSGDLRRVADARALPNAQTARYDQLTAVQRIRAGAVLWEKAPRRGHQAAHQRQPDAAAKK